MAPPPALRAPRERGVSVLSWTERPWFRPTALFAAALAYRTVLVLWTTTIAADGGYHLMTAQGFLDGRAGEFLALYLMHPLHPTLTALAGSLLGSVESGGYAVAVLGSSLAVVPLWALVRRLWSERVATWSGILYALHPVLALEGSEVLNTGTFLAAFLGTLALGVAAIQRGRILLFVAAGASSGLAYLTRPEGLLLPAALVGLAVGTIVARMRKHESTRRLVAGVIAASSIGVMVAAPYLLWIRSHTGQWGISTRTAARLLLPSSQTPRSSPSPPQNPAPDPSDSPVDSPATLPSLASPSPSAERGSEPPIQVILKKIMKAVFPPLSPFVLLGVLMNRRLGGSRIALVWAGILAVGSLVPSILLYIITGTVHPSHRYFLPAVALFLPWAAAGLLHTGDWLARAVRNSSPRLRLLRWAPVTLALAVLVIKGAGPRRADEAAFRTAGDWLREQGFGPGSLIVTRSDKIAWYGGLRPSGIVPLESAKDFENACRITASPLVVLTSTHRPESDEALLRELTGNGFEPAAVFRGEHLRTVRILRLKQGP